ncbi:CBS domain-containing protein [Pyxidicoccus sp. 3LFB2]
MRRWRADTPLKDAVALMLQHKYGCLPVVDEGGLLQGIVTEADLVRYAQYLIEERDRREMAAEFSA